MKKTFVALLAALACQMASAAVQCLPSDFAGTGSVFTGGANTKGWWTAWWCPGVTDVQVLAMNWGQVSVAMAPDLYKLANSLHTATLNEVLATWGASDVKGPLLSPLWNTVEGREKINAIKPK